MVDHVEEMSLKFLRKMQDWQEVMSETSGRKRVEAGTRRRNGDAGNQRFLERSGRRPDSLMVKVTMSGCK